MTSFHSPSPPDPKAPRRMAYAPTCEVCGAALRAPLEGERYRTAWLLDVPCRWSKTSPEVLEVCRDCACHLGAAPSVVEVFPWPQHLPPLNV